METKYFVVGGPPAPKPGRIRGPAFRIGNMMHVFDYLPPVMMQTLDEFGKPTSPWVPMCGKCFSQLGDDPFDGKPGQTRPLVIENNRRCARCTRRCFPFD